LYLIPRCLTLYYYSTCRMSWQQFKIAWSEKCYLIIYNCCNLHLKLLFDIIMFSDSMMLSDTMMLSENMLPDISCNVHISHYVMVLCFMTTLFYLIIQYGLVSTVSR
jgi:hypothetical protein